MTYYEVLSSVFGSIAALFIVLFIVKVIQDNIENIKDKIVRTVDKEIMPFWSLHLSHPSKFKWCERHLFSESFRKEYKVKKAALAKLQQRTREEEAERSALRAANEMRSLKRRQEKRKQIKKVGAKLTSNYVQKRLQECIMSNDYLQKLVGTCDWYHDPVSGAFILTNIMMPNGKKANTDIKVPSAEVFSGEELEAVNMGLAQDN